MILKEQLVGMGLTEEQAQKVISEVIDGAYIPKTRFNEVNEENKTLKKSVAERDGQLEELKISRRGDFDKIHSKWVFPWSAECDIIIISPK